MEFYKIKAFTLVELLISLSIIAIMAVLSIGAYPKFSAQLSTVSESYRLLSFLKETQSYGISSYGEIGQKLIYGIEINKTNNTIKRVLVDDTGNNLSNAFSSSFKNSDFLDNKTAQIDAENTFTFKGNYQILKICLDLNCSGNSSGDTEIAYAVYKRPNPEARIFTINGTIINPNPSIKNDTSSLDKIVIYLSNTKDKDLVKKIVILATGQIYIE